jgi:hypothetical protein
VISQVRDRFQTEITLRQLFEFPTVAELAQQIENNLKTSEREERPTIVPVRRVAMPVSNFKPRDVA